MALSLMTKSNLASKYRIRKTHDYHIGELPFGTADTEVQLINISAIRINFEDTKKFYDIGALVYTDRKASPESNRYLKRGVASYCRYKVNSQTYRKSRKVPVERYIEYLYIEAKKGMAPRTLEMKSRIPMRFILWCDDNGFEACLDSLANARGAFRAYIDHLEHQHKIYDPSNKVGLASSTATSYQNTVLTFLLVALEIKEISLIDGLRLLVKKGNEANTVLAIDHETLGRNLAIWCYLFRNISNFVLSNKKYPFNLPLPEENVWVFPCANPFLTQRQITKRRNTAASLFRTTGRAIEADDSELHINLTPKVKSQIKRFKKQLDNANSDFRHSQRYRLGKIAHDAFFMMFMLYTRTRSDIRLIKWNSDASVETSKSVGFKVIKARAKGRTCEYQITARFLREFNQYLKLRRWLLDDQSFDYLFLRLDKYGKPKQTPISTAEEFNSVVIQHLIDSDFPVVTPSQCRASGADHIINKYDIATAASMLQNKESTLKKYYANGNHQRASKQITTFFKKLRDKIIYVREKTPSHIEVPTGYCSEFGQPKAEAKTLIEVDCRTPQGCLFCDNYAVHADKIDIRKLLSLEYVIKETKILANNIEHFESIYGELLSRIKSILSEIQQLDKSYELVVSRIRKEVYDDEKLSPYWDNKLRQLVNMGVL